MRLDHRKWWEKNSIKITQIKYVREIEQSERVLQSRWVYILGHQPSRALIAPPHTHVTRRKALIWLILCHILILWCLSCTGAADGLPLTRMKRPQGISGKVTLAKKGVDTGITFPPICQQDYSSDDDVTSNTLYLKHFLIDNVVLYYWHCAIGTVILQMRRKFKGLIILPNITPPELNPRFRLVSIQLVFCPFYLITSPSIHLTIHQIFMWQALL